MIFGKKNKTIEISNNKIKFDNENSKGRQFYLLPYRGKEIDPHSLLKTLFSRDGKFSVGYYKKNNGGQYIRFWAEEGRDQVESAILTNFRKSQIEEADGFMNTERNLIGGALHLRSSDFFPLKMRSDDGVRNSDREDDLAKHIFAELRDSQGEYLVQILFKGAKDFNFSKYVIKETFGGIGPRKKIKRLDEKDISKKSDQLARDIEEKMKDECFKVQIRFLGSGASEEELVQTFNNVSSALSQFNYNTSDGNKASLKLINPDNLKNFVSDVKNREFHDASKLYQKVLPFLKKDPHPRFLCSDELKYFLQIPVEDLDEYRIKDAAKKEHPISARGKEKMEQSEVQAIYGKTQRGEKAKVTDFRHHVYVSGKTGMGKSTVLQHLTLNRIKKGKNVIVLDPHGDLINEIIQRIDRDRLKDVIYISPHSPLGFNALNLPGFPKSDRKKLDRIGKRSLKELEMSQNEKHARALSNMIKDHFGDEFWGPRLDSIFNWFAQGLLDEKGSNFVDFYHILCDEETARKFAKDTQMQELEHYINTFFNQLQDRDKHSTLNKIGKIRRSKVLRKMLCIRQPDLQISELIEDGKIVFINLSKGLHDSDTGHFIGSALSNLIWSCIQQRLLVRDEKKRGETYLVVDEFQSFANDIFKDMLSEGRKVGLRLVLANQYLGQLDHDLWKAIAGNVETFINFASSVEDAKILSDYYGDKVEDHEFVNLQKFNALANYEGSEVNSVRTNPPSPPKNNDLLEDILERMERISPNEGMKKQRANTPIWSNEETERWDILTGIYRKQIEFDSPPKVAEVKKEEPRNNINVRLRKMDTDGIIEYNTNTSKSNGDTVNLNQNSIEELFKLIGSSTKAGKEGHKEMILKVWEILEKNGIRTHIIRQDQQGKLPDMTVEYSDQANLNWGGSDIEIEKSTITKPTKILSNLVTAENKDRKLLFFVDNEENATRIYDIIRNPYTSDGDYYKDTKGRKFKPEVEFTRKYWAPSDKSCNLFDLCGIYILDKGLVKQYRPGRKNHEVILTHDGVLDGGDYLIDEVRKYEQDALPQGTNSINGRDGEDENFESKERDECIISVRGKNENEVPWLVEEDGAITLSKFVKQSLDKIKKDDETIYDEKRKRSSEINKIVEWEYKCAELESTRRQPEGMELHLSDVPHPQRFLILTVEAMYTYSKYQKHGYRIPQKPISIKTLMECLKEKGNAEIPNSDKSFGKKYSDFLKSLGVKAQFKKERNRNYYNLHTQSNILKSMYKFKIAKSVGEGHYTYPLLYQATGKTLGRHTTYKLFDRSEIEHKGLTVDLFDVEFDSKCQLLRGLANAPENKLSLEELDNNLEIEREKIDEILREWNINLDKKDALKNLSRNMHLALAPFLNEGR